MRFGVVVSTSPSVEDLVERVKRIEEWKYDTIWVADTRFQTDPYPILALCGLNTKKVQIGTNVINPYTRHPALTARAIATVDYITKGRAILGISTGYSGFWELGIERKKPVLAMRESVNVIRLLWGGETVTFDGEIVKLRDTKLGFTTRYDIPIYIASRGPKLLSLAGELCEGVSIGSLISRNALQYAVKWVKRGLKKAGRNINDIDINMHTHTAISKDGDAARKRLKPMIVRIIQSSRPIIKKIGLDEEEVNPILEILDRYAHDKLLARKLAADLVTNGLIETFALAGSVDEVIEKVSVLEKMGVKQISINPISLSDKDSYELIRCFSEEIMPKFR